MVAVSVTFRQLGCPKLRFVTEPYTCACNVENETQGVHQWLDEALVQRIVLQRLVKSVPHCIQISIYALAELDGAAYRVAKRSGTGSQVGWDVLCVLQENKRWDGAHEQ
jgi:hypothetical protein